MKKKFYCIEHIPGTCLIKLTDVSTGEYCVYEGILKKDLLSTTFIGGDTYDDNCIVGDLDAFIEQYNEDCAIVTSGTDDEKQQYINPTKCWAIKFLGKEIEEVLEVVEYFDCVNNEFVQFLEGSELTESNIFNPQNYTLMKYDPRERGRLSEASAVVVTPIPFPGTITICTPADTDVDVADSLLGSAPMIAFLATLPPLAPGATYGIVTAQGHKIEGQKGKTVDCDLTGATDTPLGEVANVEGSFTTPYDANTNILPGGDTGVVGNSTTPFTYVNPDDATDCKPAYAAGSELATGNFTVNNGDEDGAFDFTLCIACFAPAPAAK